jgi:hypothetical protein
MQNSLEPRRLLLARAVGLRDDEHIGELDLVYEEIGERSLVLVADGEPALP